MNTLFDSLGYVSGCVRSIAAARGEIGRWAEELAARALGLSLTPINGSSLCPDFIMPSTLLRGEIKAVGASGQAIIYKWRIAKEEMTFGSDYLYVFVRHKVPLRDVVDRSDVIAAFARYPVSIITCTLGDIRAAIGERPAKLFSLHSDPSHGSQRGGYKEGGWQFRLSAIETNAGKTVDVEWPSPMRTHIRVQVSSTANFNAAATCPPNR